MIFVDFFSLSLEIQLKLLSRSFFKAEKSLAHFFGLLRRQSKEKGSFSTRVAYKLKGTKPALRSLTSFRANAQHKGAKPFIKKPQ
jgi:ribosomal protein L22